MVVSGSKSQQWLESNSIDKVGCSNSVCLDTNTYHVETVEERTWCQHALHVEPPAAYLLFLMCYLVELVQSMSFSVNLM